MRKSLMPLCAAAFMACMPAAATEKPLPICLANENTPERVAIENRIREKYAADFNAGRLTLDHLAGRIVALISINPALNEAMDVLQKDLKKAGYDFNDPEVRAGFMISFISFVDLQRYVQEKCPAKDASLRSRAPA